MDIKELNKIAKACRKLGIKHLKTDEFEIELGSDIQPIEKKTRSRKAVNESIFEEASLTPAMNQTSLSDAELLFWSSENTQ